MTEDDMRGDGKEREILLQLFRLEKRFPVSHSVFWNRKYVHAVNGVSFALFRGDTLGIVGESGSGKSTLARILSLLRKPSGGRLCFDGRVLFDSTGTGGNKKGMGVGAEELRRLRAWMQMVFQDPESSLNPRYRIDRTIREALLQGWRCRGAEKGRRPDEEELLRRSTELLRSCGLREEDLFKYPHQFSGGQKQRISIARSMALEPELIVFDESVASLDVIVQAQILNMLQDQKEGRQLTYIFISHDLNVIHYFCNRVIVLYLGFVVEIGPTREVFLNPRHPYTQLLVDSVSKHSMNVRGTEAELPSNIELPLGCPFYAHCPKRKNLCRIEIPTIRDPFSESGSQAACHFPDS